MTKKIKKERKFKREYIPVVFLSLLLIVLLVVLFMVIKWDKKDYNIDIPKDNKPFDEVIVDTSNSSCDAATISKLYEKASKITFDYEPKKVVVDRQEDEDGNMMDVYGWTFDITFENIPEDMYVIVKNDSTLEEEKPKVRIEYKDTKKGKYTYTERSTIMIVNYTVEVYTKNENCADELFRRFKFKTPIYNRYHDMDICKGYPEFKWCKQFVTESRPSWDEFFIELNDWGKKNKIKITSPMEAEAKENEEIDCEAEGMYEIERQECREFVRTSTTKKTNKKDKLDSFSNETDKDKKEPTIKVGDKEIKTTYIYLGVAGVLLVAAVAVSATIYLKKRKK